VNLLYSLKQAGFAIREIATEWSDKSGSKVVFNLRTSLNMLLSLIRLRLIYSPFYRWLGPLRPVEAWLYTQLRAPQPIWHDEHTGAGLKAGVKPKPDPTTSRSQ